MLDKDKTKQSVTIEESVLGKWEALRGILLSLNSVLVAYSGGVDSTLLLKAAHDALDEKASAVTVKGEVHPQWEVEGALQVARGMGVEPLLVELSVLDHPAFAANPPDRCYHCKSLIFTRLKEIAREQALAWVVEGSNRDDLGDYRPGRRALEELGVRSPLLEADLTKAEIRSLSRYLDLPTWDRSSLACLAILLFLSVVHLKHIPPSVEGAPGGLEVSVGVDGIVSPILAVLFLLPHLLSSLEEFVIGPSGISGKLRMPEILGQAHSTPPGKAVEAVEAHAVLKAVPSVPAAMAEALLAEPDDIRTGYTLKDLAQMYLNQGRREDALQALGRTKEIFENVLKQHPDNASAYSGLGNIYYLQGEYEKAVGQYQEALGRAPDYAAAYNDIALACEALMVQDKEKSEYWKQKAAEHWEKFLQLAQDNPQFPPDYVQGARRRYRALRGW
jgi:uncharacterized protein (TIGR00268 family)